MAEISITYSERTDKPTIAFTGVYGGPAPDGSAVVAHLFVEYGTIPIAAKHEIEGPKILKRDVEVLKKSDVTREVQGTLVMSAESAAMLGKFLQEKAAMILAQKNNQAGV